jgi:hypothetical protein
MLTSIGGGARVLGVLGLLAGAGCGASASQPADPHTTPIYNKDTGRLETIISDHDGDGRPDTWAHMDGAVVKSIEIDRDGDGRPDRWEYYMPAPADGPKGGPASLLDHADEANGPDRTKVTRREFFVKGVLQRTEEDTDFDGKIDKWEYYEGTVLTRVEFDLSGHGYPDRRLIYGPDGNVIRVEMDTRGDGKFEPVPPPPATKGRGR